MNPLLFGVAAYAVTLGGLRLAGAMMGLPADREEARPTPPASAAPALPKVAATPV